ncbi:3-ketodihydrosphingosine reductase [Anaeramoeba flamelloides]|uniref:3-ketodihydrosphingosine reductase n=1 Tax=Anaeramoeba flamelloides TaxID=1746091 RepID=A0ABQ8YSS8_9EUKA|nr:3-ketodihydrosphingosine reductase [Anaeramoeba flamelloides]
MTCYLCTFRSILSPIIPQINSLNDNQLSAILLFVVSLLCLWTFIRIQKNLFPIKYDLENKHIVIIEPFTLFTKAFAYQSISCGSSVTLIGNNENELLSIKRFLKQHSPTKDDEKEKNKEKVKVILSDKRSRKSIKDTINYAIKLNGPIHCLVCNCKSPKITANLKISEEQLVQACTETLSTLNSIRLSLQSNDNSNLEQIIIVANENVTNSPLELWIEETSAQLKQEKSKIKLNLFYEKEQTEKQIMFTLFHVLIQLAKKGSIIKTPNNFMNNPLFRFFKKLFNSQKTKKKKKDN